MDPGERRAGEARAPSENLTPSRPAQHLAEGEPAATRYRITARRRSNAFSRRSRTSPTASSEGCSTAADALERRQGVAGRQRHGPSRGESEQCQGP